MCGPNGENNNQASRFWLSVSSHLENDMEEVRHTQTSKSPPAISRMAGFCSPSRTGNDTARNSRPQRQEGRCIFQGFCRVSLLVQHAAYVGLHLRKDIHWQDLLH